MIAGVLAVLGCLQSAALAVLCLRQRRYRPMVAVGGFFIVLTFGFAARFLWRERAMIPVWVAVDAALAYLIWTCIPRDRGSA